METIATHPGVVLRFARHHVSGRPPPKELLTLPMRDANHFVGLIQQWNIGLNLHGPGFDPHAARAEDVRAVALKHWQRYSLVQADPAFSPLLDSDQCKRGCKGIAYLLCYLRNDELLHSGERRHQKDMVRSWLQPGFARRLRHALRAAAQPEFCATLCRDLPEARREGRRAACTPAAASAEDHCAILSTHGRMGGGIVTSATPLRCTNLLWSFRNSNLASTYVLLCQHIALPLARGVSRALQRTSGRPGRRGPTCGADRSGT
eukprot:NODE_15419_length_1051_cov_2.713203.p1 GENE.NODE_15419_length_1051_cov_2.713203~~NODE_15419_length_1051_cov_2.713203.p1  ORF type:complete len:302 (+),score=22.09 NODE_15419_length_1051_cov_2.713203:121-906(+)